MPGRGAMDVGKCHGVWVWYWGFPWIFLFTFFIPFQAWLGRWVCRHRGVGRSEVRDWGGRGINIILY